MTSQHSILPFGTLVWICGPSECGKTTKVIQVSQVMCNLVSYSAICVCSTNLDTIEQICGELGSNNNKNIISCHSAKLDNQPVLDVIGFQFQESNNVNRIMVILDDIVLHETSRVQFSKKSFKRVVVEGTDEKHQAALSLLLDADARLEGKIDVICTSLYPTELSQKTIDETNKRLFSSEPYNDGYIHQIFRVGRTPYKEPNDLKDFFRLARPYKEFLICNPCDWLNQDVIRLMKLSNNTKEVEDDRSRKLVDVTNLSFSLGNTGIPVQPLLSMLPQVHTEHSGRFSTGWFHNSNNNNNNKDESWSRIHLRAYIGHLHRMNNYERILIIGSDDEDLWKKWLDVRTVRQTADLRFILRTRKQEFENAVTLPKPMLVVLGPMVCNRRGQRLFSDTFDLKSLQTDILYESSCSFDPNTLSHLDAAFVTQSASTEDINNVCQMWRQMPSLDRKSVRNWLDQHPFTTLMVTPRKLYHYSFQEKYATISSLPEVQPPQLKDPYLRDYVPTGPFAKRINTILSRV